MNEIRPCTEDVTYNADGTVDFDDVARVSPADVVASGAVAAWEITLPPGLEDAAVEDGDVCVWVDPLDGTREYVEGPEHWSGVTVLIGVSVKGVPVAGVIHQPFVGVGGTTAVSTAAITAGREGCVSL